MLKSVVSAVIISIALASTVSAEPSPVEILESQIEVLEDTGGKKIGTKQKYKLKELKKELKLLKKSLGIR